MKALVTGGAGFIGSHLVDGLLSDGWDVTVVDNFDPFYDPHIKEINIQHHMDFNGYRLIKTDIRDYEGLKAQLPGDYDVIVHLAAKAGVRPSIQDPFAYQEVNVQGTQHLLELAKLWLVKQFIFASSSSVYGINPNVPWNEEDNVLLPISPYASTKVSSELMGHVYSHLYGIRFISLRFFTVCGPRQRPDLAIHKFTNLMLKGQAIPIYGNGNTRRDYTFVSDIVQGIRAAMNYRSSNFEIINLGNNQTVTIKDLVAFLEECIGLKAKIEYLPEQLGDVPQTWADLNKAKALLGYEPKTQLKDGLITFISWYKEKCL